VVNGLTSVAADAAPATVAEARAYARH
jgi:hypothetical protein